MAGHPLARLLEALLPCCCGAALIITVATVIAFPESYVYFGILHAIALFSLLALPFLRAPLWLVIAVAAIVTLIPMVYADPLYDQRALVLDRPLGRGAARQ